MKLLIITSDQLRHRHFASVLAKNFNVVGAILEGKKRDPSTKGDGTPSEKKVREYFLERDRSELFFWGDTDWPKAEKQLGRVKEIKAGEINHKENIAFIRNLAPDYIVVFGSSILGEDIIESVLPDHIINMHLGLSPYYRGSGTNFWPMYEDRLEYVGVTIHYLDRGIDSGKIIIQGRPVIELGDTPHSIGNKTIEVGVKLVVGVLERLGGGEKIIGERQDLSGGRLYLFKDCTANHILELEKRFADGLVGRYLKRSISEPKLIKS